MAKSIPHRNSPGIYGAAGSKAFLMDVNALEQEIKEVKEELRGIKNDF